MGISLHSRLASNSLLTDFGLLAIPLPHPPEYWDYRHAPPCLAQGPPVFVLLFCFLNPEAEGMPVDPNLLVTAARSLPPAVSPGQVCPMVREGVDLTISSSSEATPLKLSRTIHEVLPQPLLILNMPAHFASCPSLGVQMPLPQNTITCRAGRRQRVSFVGSCLSFCTNRVGTQYLLHK